MISLTLIVLVGAYLYFRPSVYLLEDRTVVIYYNWKRKRNEIIL